MILVGLVGYIETPRGLRSLKTIFSQLIFYVVLVAHNGFSFDFLVLLAEVERRPRQLALSVFEDQNIHFSDTLPLLQKVYIHKLQQHNMIFFCLR